MRLALAVALALPLPAQDPPAETFGHSRHGAEFDEGPRQAAYLMQGMSPQVHFPVAGLGEEAQRFFDQGICQQHGFWYFEAERSFRQVAWLSPDCALAYLGMSMANVENHKRGSGFAAQAVQRAAGLPARERRWVDAWAHFHQITADEQKELQSGDAERTGKARAAIVERSKDRDEKKLARELVRDLEEIVAAEPESVEPKAFLVVQIWRNVEAGLEITSHGAVDALLDQIFAVAPLHPAHHFRVHLWDRERAERAVRSAATLGQTAPGIAHQWHMGGHIFDKLGRYADAAWQQEASSRIDHAFMQRDLVQPYEIHNYGHNQEWLCRSLSNVGRARDAVALAKNMIELPRHPTRNRVEADDDIAGYGRLRLLEVLTTYECWDELAAVCTDGHVEPTKDPDEQLRRLGALGTAWFRRGDPAAGDRVLAELDAWIADQRAARGKAIDAAEDHALDKKAADGDVSAAMVEAQRQPTDLVRRALRVRHELRGERWLAAGDAKAALAEFEQAPGTAPWTLACARQALGEHDAAIKALVDALPKKGGRVPPLARLVVALHKAGRQDEARTRFEELRPLAAAADLDLPLLLRLREVALGFGWPADWRLEPAAAADVGVRPPLDSLGPFRWQPQPAPALDLAQAFGGRLTLASRRGKPTLLVFYLGFGCSRCVEQLRAFAPKCEAFAQAGIDVIAIGTESVAKVEEQQQSLPQDQRHPMPLACDPELAAFHRFRAYDDFEHMPLHSTVLIDGEGAIRWQDISFEPFREVDWLLGECQRLLALPTNAGSR